LRGNWAINHQSGMAAIVPMVPGALADRPLPKPKASTNTGERASCERVGLLAKVVKPLLINVDGIMVTIDHTHQICCVSRRVYDANLGGVDLSGGD